MAEVLDVVREAPRQYARIARLWIRSSLSYRTSFAILTLSSMLITFLDFVGLWLMLHLIGDLDGFALWEIALLYGASGIGIGVADLLIGSVEQIGRHIRTGTLDAMLVRPVPLLVQVCADRFAIRRLGRITQAVVVFAWGAWHVDWTPTKVVVALLMMVVGERHLLRAVRGLLLRPVLDPGRQRVRERLHLRRQHDDAVPPQHLPDRGREDR